MGTFTDKEIEAKKVKLSQVPEIQISNLELHLRNIFPNPAFINTMPSPEASPKDQLYHCWQRNFYAGLFSSF